jgi:hypothetical protein
MPFLFSKEPVEQYLERFKINLKREIESTDINYILTVSEDDYMGYLISKYALPKLVLHEKDIKQHQEEIRLNGHEKPTAEHATMLTGKLKVTISIPFEGISHFFNCTPSGPVPTFPQGEVQHVNRLLQLSYEVSDRNADSLKSIFSLDIKKIKHFLELINNDIFAHNLWVNEKAKPFLLERKTQVLQNLGFAKSLGIPFQEDTTLPKTYPIPLKTETITINKPEATRNRFEPEPAIDQSNYEKILEVISHMSLAMERSPQTFSKLSEEEIRDFFLIVLNSHFKGQATGETFNNQGRTDILLRVEDKNAFIAECKFWKGAKSFLRAIDQILNYMSWRDTKVSILIFHKGKNFSRILTKIPKIVSEHECYKRAFTLNNQKLINDSTFSAMLSNRNDKNRELFLTVLAFSISYHGLSNLKEQKK